MIDWRGLRGEWLMVGSAALISLVALTLRGGGPLETGGHTEVEVTVVPMDATQLACAGSLGEANCAFDAQGIARPHAPSPLRPYVTTGGQLIVVSGLFESSAVATWLESARGTDVRAKVRCPTTVLAADALINLRFRASDAFAAHHVPVLSGRDCQVVP